MNALLIRRIWLQIVSLDEFEEVSQSILSAMASSYYGTGCESRWDRTATRPSLTRAHGLTQPKRSRVSLRDLTAASSRRLF